jgi:hypothetical protein
MKCPGQDWQYWKPGDIFDVPCPSCGEMTEFYKDEVQRRCRKCGTRFRNPRIDLGCLEWCEHAEKCAAGQYVEDKDPWGAQDDKSSVPEK